MTASPSRRRTSGLGAVLAALALTVSACGGDDAGATDKPTSSTSTSVTPTPTPTPTPTATQAPLSPFEDKPPVKAARAWAVAYAKAVNAGDRGMSEMRPITTVAGLAVSKAAAADDFAHGYLQPGPEPFTPVNVQTQGSRARISLCLLVGGWSVDRKTNKPAGRRQVEPTVFNMVREGGRWKFDSGTQGTADCSGVEVPGVKW